MLLKLGQAIKGTRSTYELIQSLKSSSVFKAVLSQNAAIPAQFTVVKTETAPEQEYLRRERHNHSISAIAKSPFFRSVREVIDSNDSIVFDVHEPSTPPFCMVFEWMDHDLRSVSPYQFRSDSNLPKIVARSVLSALATLHDLKAIHTDISPNNICLSNVQGPSPIVKVGDLGTMCPQGMRAIRVQTLETRAPEVWRGLGCWYSSDVWSLGVTLAHWLHASTIFGPHGKFIQDLKNEWCIAKMMHLVGPIDDPVENEDYECEFEVARVLVDMEFEHPDTNTTQRVVTVERLRAVLENSPRPPIAKDLLDFTEYLLVVDHTRRPTAAEALKHPYLM